ncbi:FkbM family methyltransferase [Morganella morganii]
MENKTLPEFDICTTRGDHRFLLTSGPDYISGVLRGGELWNASSINISQRLLEFVAAPVIYDIGANLGSWTILVGNYFQHRNGIVYSFEPQRQVYNQLCGNIFLNKLKNCYTFNSALGDYDGEIDVPVFDPMTDGNLGAVSLDKTIFSEQRRNTTPQTEKKNDQYTGHTKHAACQPAENRCSGYGTGSSERRQKMDTGIRLPLYYFHYMGRLYEIHHREK